MRFEFTHTHIYPGATADLSGSLPATDGETTCLVELSDGVVLSTSCSVRGGRGSSFNAGVPHRSWREDTREDVGATQGR